MKYDERMPVVAFRIKRSSKDLLDTICDDLDLNINTFCRKVIEAYLRQKDMFEIVYKKEN